ncbi:MAG: TetR/AcrR family transcriptional regulator [Actinobacteria bacterium]|nr:TetR/AcrR family transcriptional regulator [Actinomycetota bacterium]
MSPNQQAKRDEIVDAAVEVLLHEGVHGCTVRSIAATAGVSKGAVHYYFSDVEDIIDQAMLKAARIWIQWLGAGGSSGLKEPASPIQLFWHAMSICLAPFAHGDRSLMPLWLEYWAMRSRANRIEPLQVLQELMISYVTELMEAAGVADAPERAIGVTAYLFGVSMQESILSVPKQTVMGQIAALCGLDPPKP